MTASNSKGRLFVFEGADGCGKTTLARRFTDYLSDQGIPSELLAFPGNDPGTLGQLVYEIHHKPADYGIQTLTSASRQLLHVAAHFDAIDRIVRPALAAGRTVVLDRFWWSTWVYGQVSGVPESTLKGMIELERLHWASDQPAAVFLMCRAAPLRHEPMDEWRSHVEEYEILAKKEESRTPVFFIPNETSIAETLTLVIARAHSLSSTRPTGYLAKPDCSVHSLRVPSASEDQPWLALEPKTERKVGIRPHIFVRLSPAKPTIVYETYWRFAAERQAIFFRRQKRHSGPWTDDPILREHKFTNAYRASDRVSQYLIRDIIYKGDSSPIEIFFRTILFKFFNRIETWELLTRELYEISWADYSFEKYDKILTQASASNQRLYSAAYIMPSGGRVTTSDYGGRKHRMHLRLLERMIGDKLPEKLKTVGSMAEAFELLRAYPSIGDFLAYQYVTDLNYSLLTDFSEMSFVVPGPGALNGIRKCFSDLGGLSEIDLIKLVTDRQEQDFAALDLTFQDLWGRRLQLIDCQNLFCEVDKYARIRHPEFTGLTGRTRIKQRFRHASRPIHYWFPPKWEINHRLSLPTSCEASN